MKAHEVRFQLKGKIDPVLQKVLEQIADDYNQQQKELILLANAVDAFADRLSEILAVQESTIKVVDKIRKHRGLDDEETQ